MDQGLEDLVKRYKHIPQMIGVDQRNEVRSGPLGTANWGEKMTSTSIRLETSGNPTYSTYLSQAIGVFTPFIFVERLVGVTGMVFDDV